MLLRFTSGKSRISCFRSLKTSIVASMLFFVPDALFLFSGLCLGLVILYSPAHLKENPPAVIRTHIIGKDKYKRASSTDSYACLCHHVSQMSVVCCIMSSSFFGPVLNTSSFLPLPWWVWVEMVGLKGASSSFPKCLQNHPECFYVK